MVRFTENMATAIVGALRGDIPLSVDLADAVQTVVREQMEQPNAHRDLLDTMESILQGSKAKMVLSGQTLMALRGALMSPRMLEIFKAGSREGWRCTKCLTILTVEEIGVVAGKDDILCSRCYTPSTGRCPDGHIIYADFRGLLRRAAEKCEICQANKERAARGEPPIETPTRLFEEELSVPEPLLRTREDELRGARPMRGGAGTPTRQWRGVDGGPMRQPQPRGPENNPFRNVVEDANELRRARQEQETFGTRLSEVQLEELDRVINSQTTVTLNPPPATVAFDIETAQATTNPPQAPQGQTVTFVTTASGTNLTEPTWVLQRLGGNRTRQWEPLTPPSQPQAAPDPTPELPEFWLNEDANSNSSEAAPQERDDDNDDEPFWDDPDPGDVDED